MAYLLDVAGPELRRITAGRTLGMLVALLVAGATAPLLARGGWLEPWIGPDLLERQLVLALLVLQALLAPVLGGGEAPSDTARRRGMQLLLLAPAGPGRYLLGLYAARAAALLLLGLVPLPIWLLGGAAYPEPSVTLDLWLAAACGPFVFCALALLCGQAAGAEVLGFLAYCGMLGVAAAYLWGLGVAGELAEIRPLVLVFLLWLACAALLLTRKLFTLALAAGSAGDGPESVRHALSAFARRVAAAARRLAPRAFADPLLYLALFRPPAPPIGLAWLVTLWLLFIGCVLELVFALLPYHLAEGGAEAVALHLGLVTAAVCGVLLAPAALAMASFHGASRVHELLRLAPCSDADHFRARERAGLVLCLPLVLLPAGLQGLFALALWPAATLALLVAAGQFLALEAGFLFCRARSLGEGLLAILVSTVLLFVLLPALGAPLTQPALRWAALTLPRGYEQSLAPASPWPTAALALFPALALGVWHRRRFRLPPLTGA